MNNFNKDYVNDEGNHETIVATSEDDYEVKLSGGYTLANHKVKKENRLVKKFKGSILGADIGVKSGGFSSIAILATVIALAVIVAMYFMWRF